MTKESTAPNREAFSRRVSQSLQKAEKHVAKLKKTNSWLQISSIVSSAVTTLVAGITAAQGPVVGEGIPGWQISCAVAAVFGFATTVLTGVNQQLKIGDQLSAGNECTGRLRSLDVAISTDSRTWEEMTKEYQEIAKIYPDLAH